MAAPARTPLPARRADRARCAGGWRALPTASVNPRRSATYNRDVARFHDWVELGKNTLRSLKASDVANFYSYEWPETRRVLMAEHAADIENERRAWYRWVRTASAVMFGVAKKLAPLRRFAFVFANIYFIFCLFALASSIHRIPV